MSTTVHEEIHKAANLIEGFFTVARLYPDRIAQKFKGQDDKWHTRTYQELAQRVDVLSQAFLNLGLRPLEGVGVLAENSPLWNEVDLAALSVLAPTVGFYANDTPDDVAYKLMDAQVRVLFVDSVMQLEKVEAVPVAQAPCLEKVVGMDDALTSKDPRFVTYHDFAKAEVTPAVAARRAQVGPHTVMRLVYTSGTTGRPKGVVLTHNNVRSNIESASHAITIDTEHGVTASYLPSAHSFQMFLDHTTLLTGGCLGYLARKTLAQDLPQIRPTLFPGVPKAYKMIFMGIAAKVKEMSGGAMDLMSDSFDGAKMGAMIRAAAGLDKVTFFVCGAAKLDVTLAQALESKVGIRLMEGYGLSETSPVIAVNCPGEYKLGAVGKVIEGMNVKIVDEEDPGKILPTGEIGELVVQGPNVFHGYLNKPESTADVLRHGWFYTGDRASLDGEGYLTVYGRKGNRVKFANGEFYDVEEIGDKFLRHCKLLSQVVVVGEHRPCCVAIISLAEDLIIARAVAAQLGLPADLPAHELVYHEAIVAAARREFEAVQPLVGHDNPLEKIHKALYVRPFSADNQEATATGKTRIKYVTLKFAEQVDKLYAGKEEFVVFHPED